jgi:hypothetical protein
MMNHRQHDDQSDKFYPDPLLPELFREEEDDYFALGLVVAWPCLSSKDKEPNVLKEHYDDFVSTVKTTCFQQAEGFFCMPLHSLHITVASLFSACRISELPVAKTTDTIEDWMSTFVHQWKEVLIKATSLDEWPIQEEPIKLQVESAQIASTAGVLLWKEESDGKIGKMRNCLQQAVELVHPQLQQYLRIPNIIHSTFVRYNTNIRNNKRLLRPSQIHTKLLEQVVTQHPLFGIMKNKADDDDDDDDDNHNYDKKSPLEVSSNNNIIRIHCAKLVNCKIYLQGMNGEKDHDVYLTVPCYTSSERNQSSI